MTFQSENRSDTHTSHRLREQLASGLTIFDGAMGTEIYRHDTFTDRCFDELNLSRSDLIRLIHQSYRDAGADVLTTNTFGANRLNLEKYGFADKTADVNIAGAHLAREVADMAADERTILVAGSVGPIAPAEAERLNDAEQTEILSEQIAALIKGGVDFILFETLPSRLAFERAARTMRQFAGTEYILSASLGNDWLKTERLNMLFAPIEGDTPQPTAFGLNCGFGPDGMLEAAQKVMPLLTLPLVVQPNAGLPKEFEGRQLYYCSPEYLATFAMKYAKLGVRGIGGCCGTTPEQIAEIVKMTKPWSKKKTSETFSSIQTSAAELPLVPESPFESRGRLANKLARREWVTTVELTPPCGWELAETLQKTGRLAEHGIDAVNLPDGPRASSRISPTAVAVKILEMRLPIEPILHFCCRDRNLIGMQADLLGCAALGIRNILFITGDPPKLGKYPNATGVFDTDSVGLCRLQKRLNGGVDLGGESLPPTTGTVDFDGKVRPQTTDAVFGVGLDPTAPDLDRELEKFRVKIDAGATFAITQPVFNPDTLLRFLDRFGDVPIPVIAGVWPLASYKNAVFMQNEVPGVQVPDAIMARMEKASAGTKEDQIAVGIEIARDAVERLRGTVNGVQISAPLGKIEISLAVLGK